MVATHIPVQSWGAKNGHLQVGYGAAWYDAATGGAITTSTKQVRLRVSWYVRSRDNWSWNDAQALAFAGGSLGGPKAPGIADRSSAAYNNTLSGNGSMRVITVNSDPFTYSTWGSSPGSWKARAKVTGAYNGASPYHQFRLDIPARPYAAAASPTALTGVRVNDTQINLAWTNRKNAQAPYTSQKVYVQVGSGAWQHLKTVAAAASSLVVGGLSANRKYGFRVTAVGAVGGETGPTSFGPVYMTPAAPANFKAAKNASNHVVLTWTLTAGYADVLHAIERSTDGGDSWTTLVNPLSAATTTYTDTSPSATNRYRIITRTSNAPTTLWSGYVTSNDVGTTAPPLTPIPTAPAAAPANAPLEVTWQHRPGTDGAAQSKYQIRYSTNGGSSWTTSSEITSTVSSHTFAASTFTDGQTVLFEVQTWGVHANPSGWSGSVGTVMSALPAATITSPTDPLQSATVDLAWTYSQAQSSAQAGWEAELLDGVEVLETASGGTETTHSFTVQAEDAASLTVRVRVRSEAGLWSSWDSEAFDVDLLPPATLTVTATYDGDSGTVALAFEADAATPGVTAAVHSVTVQRSTDGLEFVTIADRVELGDMPVVTYPQMLDLLPTLRGQNTYLVTAYTVDGAEGEPVTVIAEVTEQMWMFLNAGDDFADVIRLGHNLEESAQASLANTSHYFDGRGRDVAFFGSRAERTLDAAAQLFGDSSTEPEVLAFVENAGIVCWRSPRGTREFVKLDPATTARSFQQRSTAVSFRGLVVDFDESVGT